MNEPREPYNILDDNNLYESSQSSESSKTTDSSETSDYSVHFVPLVQDKPLKVTYDIGEYELPPLSHIQIDVNHSLNSEYSTNDNHTLHDDYFINKLHGNLENILLNDNNNYVLQNNENAHWDTYYKDVLSRTDSPITISNHNSSANSMENDTISCEFPIFQKPHKQHFKKLTYNEVEKSLNVFYDKNTIYSSELDILTTYLKGQKYVYIQSKYLSQQKLYFLIIPALLITTIITIFAPFVMQYKWSGIFISALNALATMLISLINYFKLESSVATYLSLANQYDNLQTSLELTSSKLFFIDDLDTQKHLIMNSIKKIEKNISIIKEINTILVSEHVKQLFPVISNINIFSFIKSIEFYKKNLIIKFKDIKNEIRYILYKIKHQFGEHEPMKYNSDSDNETQIITDISNNFVNENGNIYIQNRLNYLMKTKDIIKNELINYKNTYEYIDEIFSREIKHAEKCKKYWMFWIFITPKKMKYEYTNPVIKELLQNIFIDE